MLTIWGVGWIVGGEASRGELLTISFYAERAEVEMVGGNSGGSKRPLKRISNESYQSFGRT